MPPKTATPASNRKTTQTKPQAQGEVLEVSDPIDLWYLCEKICYAKQNPMTRSDGQPMYQRVVTRRIRGDARSFGYHFPYVGEVGFDMTRSPPTPIMSRKEPYRPSEFPLSAYEAIFQELRGGSLITRNDALLLNRSLLTKAELEELLVPENGGGVKSISRRPKGLIRIPDVLRVKDFNLMGRNQYEQPNLHFVIEIKFENDKFLPTQREMYKLIAPPGALRLLTAGRCQCGKRRRDDRHQPREAASKREPAYVPVAKAMERSTRRSFAYLPEHELLLSEIDHELQEVQQRLKPLPTDPKVPVFKAAPSREEEAHQAAQRQRTRAGMEMVLALPLAGAAAGTAIYGAPLLAGVATEVASGGRVGAQIIQFPRVLRPLTSAAGAAAVSEKLAAQTTSPPGLEVLKPGDPFYFIYFPD